MKFLPLPTFLRSAGSKKLTDVPANILPSVAAWLNEHPEQGEVQAVELCPNWAYGARQIIHFKERKPVLLYERDGKVTTIYQWDYRKGMEKVWGEYDKMPVLKAKD